LDKTPLSEIATMGGDPFASSGAGTNCGQIVGLSEAIAPAWGFVWQ